MKRQVAFREMVRDDLVTLFNWLDRPHVRRWYSTAPSSFAEVAAKLGFGHASDLGVGNVVQRGRPSKATGEFCQPYSAVDLKQ